VTLDERIAAYLAKCLPAVSHQHGHNQTFTVACALVNGFGLDEQSAMQWMTTYNQACQPPWSRTELLHKVRNALDREHRRPRGYLLNPGDPVLAAQPPVYSEAPPERKPVYDPDYLKNFTSQLTDEIDDQYLELRGEFTCWNRSPAGFLHKIFRHGEHVWVTDDNQSGNGLIWTHEGPVQNLAELNSLQTGRLSVWFLSNPVDGVLHQVDRLMSEYNTLGASLRCTECVTDWRHVVLETDDASEALWLKALCLLELPITAIYHSGKRGPHALVNLGASTVQEWHERLAPHREHLIHLGACAGTLTPVRLSRLPNCMRGQTRRLQRLLYLAPNSDGTPICRRPLREHPLAARERYLAAARYGRSATR
jgi:hypothetical protein